MICITRRCSLLPSDQLRTSELSEMSRSCLRLKKCDVHSWLWKAMMQCSESDVAFRQMGCSTSTPTVTVRLKGVQSSEGGRVGARRTSDEGQRGQLLKQICVGAGWRAAVKNWSRYNHGAGRALSSALNAHWGYCWLFDEKQNDGFMSSQPKTQTLNTYTERKSHSLTCALTQTVTVWVFLCVCAMWHFKLVKKKKEQVWIGPMQNFENFCETSCPVKH